MPALHAGELALALLYGLLTALAFALWPLGRAHDVPVGALFRDTVAPQPRWPRAIYIALTAAAVAALAALAVLLAYDRRVARHLCRRPPPPCSCCCGWSPALLMAIARARAARALDRACAWRSPISTAPAR